MASNYIKGLSIVIPSYNRKNQLCRLLDSIFSEDISNLHEVVVIDNCSEYNIYDVLSKYPQEKLRVICNPFNVRMGTNMMNTFFHCKTEWMWTVSDDDIIIEGSINKIYYDLLEEENSKIVLLKYSTDGTENIGIEKDKTVNSLESFIDYYHSEKPIRRGNLVFISNNIFNLKNLYKYLGRGYEFSYTYIPFLIPLIFALNENYQVKFSSFKIIKYKHPDGAFWSFKTVGLGLSTISHIPLNLTENYKKKFYKVFMPITYNTMFLYLLKENGSSPLKYFVSFYHLIYKKYLNISEKIIFFFYCIFLIFPYLSLKILNLLINIKKYAKNKFD